MKTLIICGTLAVCLHGADVRWMQPEAARVNRSQLLSRGVRKDNARTMAVFPGDTVVPSVYATPSSRTRLVFTNLSDRQIKFKIYFIRANGEDMAVPIVDVGTVRGGNVTIEANEVYQVTTEYSANTVDGWALIEQEIGDCVGAYAYIEWGGLPDGRSVEGLVQNWNRFHNRQLLAFDNTGGRTTIAQLINGTSQSTMVRVRVRQPSGEVVNTETFEVPAYSGYAVELAKYYAFTSEVRGSLDIEATGFGVAAGALVVSSRGINMVPGLANPEWK